MFTGADKSITKTCVNAELNFMARRSHFFDGSVIKKKLHPDTRSPASWPVKGLYRYIKVHSNSVEGGGGVGCGGYTGLYPEERQSQSQ
jgi:hypothetical protein